MICWPEKRVRSEALVSNNALWIKHPLSTYSDTARSVFVPYSFLFSCTYWPNPNEEKWQRRQGHSVLLQPLPHSRRRSGEMASRRRYPDLEHQLLLTFGLGRNSPYIHSVPLCPTLTHERMAANLRVQRHYRETDRCVLF